LIIFLKEYYKLQVNRMNNISNAPSQLLLTQEIVEITGQEALHSISATRHKIGDIILLADGDGLDSELNRNFTKRNCCAQKKS